MMAEEMLSAGKWAKELGVPEAKFKKAIKEAGVQPDAKKGACAYYSRKTAEKMVKKAGK
ncbi:MAG: DUF3606 domain-containing protein [Nitrospinota bacterium]|nr:DUF3606 domain-containing protein [Nitrospinota bacterium]